MKKIVLPLLCVIASLIAQAQPPNDEPCGAVVLPVSLQDTCLPAPYSWTAATTSATLPLPGCTWNSIIRDVWYRFTAPFNGTYTISTDVNEGSGTVDAIMGVYTASACSGSFTYLGCNDDLGPGNMPLLSLNNLVAGATYYIRMGNYNTAIANGGARICVFFSEALSVAKVGVGTINPGAELDINGSVRIRGGSPGADKVLTSDAAGVASWKDLPNKPGTIGVVSIPNSAFRAETPGIDVRLSFFSGGWVYFDNGIAGNNRMIAPVSLPQGVKVISMTMYYLDQSAAADLSVSLDRINYIPPGVSYGSVPGAVLTTSGSAAGVASQELSTGVLSEIVNNQNYGYFLRVSSVLNFAWPGDPLKLGMVSIAYETQ